MKRAQIGSRAEGTISAGRRLDVAAGGESSVSSSISM